MGGRRTKGGWCVAIGRNVKYYTHVVFELYIYILMYM